jgi:hypothetical protein
MASHCGLDPVLGWILWLIDKYRSALSAPFSFFVQKSSAISTASAIISLSSFGHMFGFRKASPFSTRAATAVIDQCN